MCELQLRKTNSGGLAQMVERSLSMREVLGSMPRFSNLFVSFGALFLTRRGPVFLAEVVKITGGQNKYSVSGKKGPERNKKIGEPGHRSQYLSHAKRALYHLS
jgi:hypothetical protein